MKLTDDGLKVFNDRYAAKNDLGEVIETPTEAARRIARYASCAEAPNMLYWEDRFFEMIDKKRFVPSTPIWANIGKTDRINQPGACFVLDIEDDLENMYEVLKESAIITKSGGGIGYNFSKIRPKGYLVHSTKGKASGAVELIRLFDSSAGMIKQGGVRRGAFMGILNCDHPEIFDFIKCKRDGGITNFNLSVGITDEFMEAVKGGSSWEFRFNGGVDRELVDARDLWDEIVESAWACGDPGIIFLDRLQETNPIPINTINCTNPCGEQPLSPGESCLLGSINLANPELMNMRLLRETVETAVRFMDNLIDVGEYPLAKIAENTRASRKIGIGILGLHDLLIKSGYAYDSPEGRDFARSILSNIRIWADQASYSLGKEKGNFPLYEKSIYPEREVDYRRNAACITIAPTGTITLLAGAEGYGIEPIFAIAYTKSFLRDGQPDEVSVFSPLFLEACNNYDPHRKVITPEVMQEVARKGSCQGVSGIPEDIQRIFKGAQDISPEDHLAMQMDLQMVVDNAISKTINLPNSATIDTVASIYHRAYYGGLKGITIFRDGCKQGVITVGTGDPDPQEEVVPIYTGDDLLPRGFIRPRPVSTEGCTEVIETGCGKMYLTVNSDPDSGEVIETFITTGSGGGCLIFTEAASRLISMAIRAGVPIDSIVEQLKSTHSCPSWTRARALKEPLSSGKSCPSAIAYAMERMMVKDRNLIQAGQEVILLNLGRDVNLKIKPTPKLSALECPECGKKTLARMEGCMTCISCGFSKC